MKEKILTVGAPLQGCQRKKKKSEVAKHTFSIELKYKEIRKITLDLFLLQDAAHHLLPEPSITPTPWKMTLLRLEKSSQIRGFSGSQVFGSSGATIVPSICNQ